MSRSVPGVVQRFLREFLYGPEPSPSADEVKGESVKLVVGLGNLEQRYVGTRHNIGFEVLEFLAAEHRASFSASRLPARVCSVHPTDEGGKLILAEPSTLMNRSGFAVAQLLDYYKLEACDLLVICDDFNLELGHLRLRGKGSHGGQNGLRHIVEQLGTPEFARLRCGIGGPPRQGSTANYVLQGFKASERPLVDDMVERAVLAVLTWNSSDLATAQQRYNGAGGDRA